MGEFECETRSEKSCKQPHWNDAERAGLVAPNEPIAKIELIAGKRLAKNIPLEREPDSAFPHSSSEQGGRVSPSPLDLGGYRPDGGLRDNPFGDVRTLIRPAQPSPGGTGLSEKLK